MTLAWPVLACDVPVFRYALERWEPDAYRLTLLHSEPLNEVEEALWDHMTQASSDPSSVNLRIRASDSDGVVDAGLEARWKEEADASPWLALYYPSAAPLQTYLWAGPLTESNCEALLDSPARQKTAKALLDGNSAVFVLLESGDVDADRTAAEILERELAASEAELELPGATNEEVPDIDETKLKIAFSTVRVSRQDPGERIFVEMLLGSEPGLRDVDAPMVFPVYGRGLALYALAGKGINSKTIREACAFVTGPCSCQVKDENPGVDILIALNWDAGIGEFLLQNPEPAALPSPALLQASAPDPPPVDAEPDAQVIAAATDVAQATPQVREDTDLREPGLSPLLTTGIVLAIGMATIALVSFTLYHRKH
jgi:hypothetical protein